MITAFGTARASVVLGLALGLIFVACSRAEEAGGVTDSGENGAVARSPDLVLIVIDTLRADRLSVYGYDRPTTPSLERYFPEADRYLRAYTAASFTSGSVVSMLSGLYPGAHGVRDFYVQVPAAITLLPELLAERGYETAAIVSNTVLTDEALGLGARFEYFDDFVDERASSLEIYERRASRTTDAALRWLATERDPERPHFLLLHYMDPHAPYDPPESEADVDFRHAGPARPVPLGPTAYQYLDGVVDAGEYLDRYDEEIAYADRELGRFLLAYDAAGLLEDAVVVFTSDHGETLLEDPPYFDHSPKIGPEVVRVPLLVRRPGRSGAVRETAVSLADLAPSMLGWIGAGEVARAEAMQGKPFDERGADDVLFQESWRSTRAAYPTPPVRSAIQGDVQWRFRLRQDGKAVEHGRLPLADGTNLAPTRRRWGPEGETVRRAVASFLETERERAATLGARVPGARIDGPKAAPALEPEQLEALRALGYAE